MPTPSSGRQQGGHAARHGMCAQVILAYGAESNRKLGIPGEVGASAASWPQQHGADSAVP